MKSSESIKNLAAAFTKAQADMSGAKKSAKNPFFKSSYANLEEVINCAKEPFASHGLGFMQFPISSEGHAGVETVIIHESGEWVSGDFLLKCVKNDPQAGGSAITYARRYGLQSACGIPSEDDDGNAASAPAPKKPAMQTNDAIKLLKDANSLASLGEVWQSLPIDIQQSAEVTNTKNELKAKFTK